MNEIQHNPYERPCADCLELISEEMFLQGTNLSFDKQEDYTSEEGNGDGFDFNQ